MKPAKFEHQLMTSLDDAVKALGEADGETRVLGGGQSLGPMMNLASRNRTWCWISAGSRAWRISRKPATC